MSKHVGIVTGTRAEYGLLARIIQKLQQDSRFSTTVFACGAHLSPEFGYTVQELKKDEISNIVPIEMLLSSVSPVGVSKSVGLATISFSDAFSHANLDAVLVLGDRYEILAAVQAAMFLGIPIIHMHGGEVTEGAFDDAIRHSITKMANVHMPATEEFAKRIRQLGESDESIFVVGAPGIDNIVNGQRVNRSELQSELNIDLDDSIALVTYHPVTRAESVDENDITPLVEAMRNNPSLTYVITYPNTDGGGKGIIEQWESLASLDNVRLVPSLGFKRYLTLMESVCCVIGNSSSGIIEAPSFKASTINIGTRQLGRPQASSIINVGMNEAKISEAIKLSVSQAHIASLMNTVNPYGEGGTASNVVEILSELDLSRFRVKAFRDLNLNE